MSVNDFFTKFFSLMSYFLVGLLASIVEWLFFYLFNKICHLHYQYATVFAIVISTFSNWVFGRLLTFRNAQKNNIFLEIVTIYLTSVVGLLLNMILMWVFVENVCINEMVSKIITTGIVFAYNYLIRTLVIYRKRAGS